MDIRSLEEQVDLLVGLGTRPTGSAAHRALVEDVAARWAALGLEVHRDRHTFTRWEVPPGAARLLVDGQDVEVSSPYPYSGTTGPEGVSGRLHLLDGLVKHWRRARGGIAVVEVPHREVPFDLLVGDWEGGAPARPPIANPVVTATLFGPSLAAARKAGVRAVVAVWRGLSPGNAEGQYLPFTFPYRDLPALWVAGEEGERVLAAAKAGTEAHLTLDAILTESTRTETIWAISEASSDPEDPAPASRSADAALAESPTTPGGESTSDPEDPRSADAVLAEGAGGPGRESILVVSHSDGVNAVEENGHIGLVEMARDAVARPHRRRMVFVLTSGHLRIPAVTAHGQATTAWLAAHPELWAGGPGRSRAVAGLVVEHLGAREFADDPATGDHGPTGALEPELLYATTRQLRDLVLEEWTGPAPAPTEVCAPGPLVHFGEGEPLYEHRIPAVCLVTAPQYLLAETSHDAVLTDLPSLQRQVESFIRLQRRLDALPSFDPVPAPSRLRKLLATLRAARLALTPVS
ncbi:hypothetical protein EDD29_8525 [Actinocorallia herbida]|uniref:PA domain-containing protein n=1 Tax=Actinocorallia herbida TaxID=58109 RepID=A0A3N1DBE4_9ACTN|nr:hypothetical protein [Actinocorallia herbida]ROO90786.1 hypothetical protein EDD29_8525 [Actinocorallia herbida]